MIVRHRSVNGNNGMMWQCGGRCFMEDMGMQAREP